MKFDRKIVKLTGALQDNEEGLAQELDIEAANTRTIVEYFSGQMTPVAVDMRIFLRVHREKLEQFAHELDFIIKQVATVEKYAHSLPGPEYYAENERRRRR